MTAEAPWKAGSWLAPSNLHDIIMFLLDIHREDIFITIAELKFLLRPFICQLSPK